MNKIYAENAIIKLIPCNKIYKIYIINNVIIKLIQCNKIHRSKLSTDLKRLHRSWTDKPMARVENGTFNTDSAGCKFIDIGKEMKSSGLP